MKWGLLLSPKVSKPCSSIAFNLVYVKCILLHLYIIFIILSIVNEQLESHEDLKSKYIEGAKERKELYNKVLELRGKQWT